jgi:hypothetical protein
VYNTTLADDTASSSDTLRESEDGDERRSDERKLLQNVAEALARLGKVKRVGLDVKDKAGFIKAWSKQRAR